MADQMADNTSTITDRMRERAGSLLGVAAALLLLIATIAYHSLEDWSWVDSFYFSTVAVTTVGFGDLTPTTDASKLFTVFYVLTGIGAITTYLDQRFRRVSDRVARRRHHAATGE